MDQKPKVVLKQIDKKAIKNMRRWGITLLRIGLGLVFLWFGALKIIGYSPATEMIQRTYTFMKEDPIFIPILGMWEALIGLGLIFNICLRLTLILLWAQMAGVMLSLILNPTLFFNGSPFLLTLEGEFVIKNIVIICASLVIGGYKIEPLDNSLGR